MTIIEPPVDMPTISEEKANEVLDDVVHSVIALRDDQGDDLALPTAEKLAKVFGSASPLVAQLILLGALRGFELGVVEATPGSDRADILVAALRRVHVQEMFGDCVEDGEVFPCATARMLNLVAGTPAGPTAEDTPAG